ncbi:hypothetical protein [Pectinatus frisingensis]|uniref:hypothetical protein n=1 Tax=Pectinatus frisingensis TaxID=865 RepID=UPI003D8094FC
MNEMFMMTTKDHPYFKICLKYCEEKKVFFAEGKKYAASLNIPENDFGLGSSTFAVKNTPAYQEKYKGLIKLDGDFLTFKHNTKIGRGWKLKRPFRPMPAIDLLTGFGGGKFREQLFIFQDKLYIHFCHESAIILPEGFIEIKASEYYSLIEKIQQEKLPCISM